jgi:hypothetical protein
MLKIATQPLWIPAKKTGEQNQRYAEVVKILVARGLEEDLFTAIALGRRCPSWPDAQGVIKFLSEQPRR